MMRWGRTGGFLSVVALLLVGGCSFARFDVAPLFSINGQSTAQADNPYAEGKAHLQEGRTARAIQSLHLALVQQPQSVSVMNVLAIAYEQIGRHDLALDYFERALEVDPTSTQTLNNLGYTALRHGHTAEAEDYFQRALQLDDRNAVVMANLNLLGHTGDGADRALAVVVREPMAVRRAAWVERTSALVQTIVTQPDPQVVAAAERAGIPPQLVSFTSR